MNWFKKKEVWVVIILLSVVLINKTSTQIKLKYSNRGPEITLEDIQIPIKENIIEAVEESKTIKVDISGAINNPGVYEVKEGDRIQEVIKLGGGFTEEANIDLVNQADYVYDGQKIIILKAGETKASVEGVSSSYINLNTATKSQLTGLSGIGDKTAVKIIEYRNNNGMFKNVDDLLKVNGIGESKLAAIRDAVVVK